MAFRKQLELSLKKKIIAAGAQYDDEPAISYRVFEYLEESRLKKKKESIMTYRKLLLTQTLVSESVDHIGEYSLEELMNVNRVLKFACILKTRLNYYK